MKNKRGIIFAGALVGILSALLVKLGNPGNMGVCVACFIRDIAGALGLHRAGVVQYIRPEVIGIVFGAFLIAFTSREFNVRGGSSPFIRFVLGFFLMIGALMFLGCPLRMILRLGGGDLNAVVGLVGFSVGIGIGIIFLNKGFSLKRNYKLTKFEGLVFPATNVALLAMLICAPAVIFFSKEGPGAMHASIMASLVVGLIVGFIAQKTRLCMVGGIRDAIMFKDFYLMAGFLAIFVFTTIGNLAFGAYNFGFEGQAVAHTDGLWNFLGMVLVGWTSVLLGGCPLRQLILSAEGNIDSVMAVLGMFVGAAFCHNFALAASPKGPTPNGMIAVIIGFVVVMIISCVSLEKQVAKTVKGVN